ncbi:MAG TPA: Nif3-like dinuclear metal center hexameric protein [Solirubrobacteraceae bacterium]|nr:Nif3-like dinuclear metal center hexameric protein [Solirubrobacteraceae bacterium]
MLPVKDVIAYIDELLDPSAFDDYGPNGLQVPGAEDVGLVATGVSAGLELFERAAAEGAELLLVHHGLFWEGQPRGLTPALAHRLRILFDAQINLAAYHLPLDAHPEIGNNALLARGLGCEKLEPFAVHRGVAIGMAGRFADPGLPAHELVDRVRALTARDPLHFDFGPERVRRIGIVSGGAARDISQAIAQGFDAFLTGEPTESVMTEAREAAIHFIAAGHYATETFGVRRLGDLLAERFGVRHVFIDVPNPV